jgi:ferredoxin
MSAQVNTQTKARTGTRLAVDWTACDGRGLCAELLPEMVRRDDWGFPLIANDAVPASLMAHARRAVAACPTLALRLEAAQP